MKVDVKRWKFIDFADKKKSSVFNPRAFVFHLFWKHFNERQTLKPTILQPVLSVENSYKKPEQVLSHFMQVHAMHLTFNDVKFQKSFVVKYFYPWTASSYQNSLWIAQHVQKLQWHENIDKAAI